MPGVYGDGSLGSLLRQILQRLRAIETQQQMTLTDGKLRPVLNFGLIPGSNPPRYGLQFVNPATGAQVMFVGVDDSGVPGVFIYDSTGTEQVRLGELATSPALYGLAVLNAGGTLQQVAGIDGASGGGGTATVVGAQVDLGASVTSIIGPSGQAVVTISGSVENNSAAGTSGYAYMGVGLDGASAPTNWINSQSNLAGSQTTLSLSATRLLTGLSAGDHTFAAKGWIDVGVASGVFGDVAVTVQPL